MNPQSNFQFPLLTIKEVKPLLQKDETVFAYEIKAITENGFLVSFYENKGLNLIAFIGEQMKCLVEITRGKVAYDKKRIQSGSIEFKYQWQKRLFEYFPELMKIRNDKQKACGKQEESLEKLFEVATTKAYQDWGLNGINLGIYQTKPLLSSSIGHFLLNEYEFEEEIDALELNDTIYIDIEEMFLRGICPLDSSKVEVQKEGQNKIAVQPETPSQPEPTHPPKRKFSFIAD
jgi:hypothetical protein